MPYYAYITISEEDKISIFEMDPDSGKLQHINDVEVTGRPAPLALSPDKRFLYVARRDSNQLSAYEVNSSSGELSPKSTVSLGTDPCYLSTDRNGRFVLSAYYNAGHAGVHEVIDGILQQEPIEWLPTATGAHCIQTDASNRYAFVPHIDNRGGPNAIYQFRFDENTGHLTPNTPLKVENNEHLGPRHYCFHPTRDFVYCTNEQACSVTAYRFDSSSGTLSAFQTVSTLPDDFAESNSCAQIQISPSGRFLYAPNRGHNSIACFSIDSDSGELTRFAIVPSEPIPRAVQIDPQGKFFFAAGLDSGRVASYAVDQDSGMLQPLETYDVGKAPMWVLITQL